MALQNIIIPFLSLFRSAGLKQAQNALGGLTKQYDSLGKTIGVAIGSMAGFSALQSAQQFVVQSVEATQKFERNLLALNQVFEDAAPQIKNFSKEVENYGLSQQQAAQASVFLGSVLKQYGFTTQESADQTQRLVTLAQDLATTYGYDVQEALLAITALFRGEYDPIEKFGVAMKQNEINAERAARGLGHLTGAAEMQADAQIRLELLFQRAGDSMGAFTRASDTLYGSQQKLNAVIGNLQVAFGAPLQKPLADVNNIFADIIQNNGPGIVAIGESLGTSIQNITPAIELLGDAFFRILQTLPAVIDLLNVALGVIGDIIELGTEMGDTLVNVLRDIAESDPFFTEEDIDPTAKAIAKLEKEQQKLNDAIKDGYDAYGTYQPRLVEIEEELQVLYSGTTVEATEARRDMALASRYAADAAYAAQQQIEMLSAANDAYTRSWIKRAVFEAQQMGTTLYELILKARGGNEIKTAGTDFVKDFFDGIADGVAKEQARLTLAAMGASEGLIEAILGAGGWETVYKKIVRDGISGLQKLQSEFDKTAAGIEEITGALEEKRKAAQEAYDTLLDDAEKAYNAFESQKKALEALEKAIQDYGASLADVGRLQILPTFTRQLGQFESNVVSTFDSIREKLTEGFINKSLLEQDFYALTRFVDDSVAKLQELGRQRDDLAQRYSLAEALIGDYRSAFTSATKLTSILSGLKATTEDVTVTEVMTGVRNLGSSFREFGITIEREYTEKIEQTINKSEALVDHFRSIAEKARTFAANLRTLREMGLDPMLFNQLVQAGVEAGGETAQALVDGGDATVSEINSIFQEIDSLGADLGEEVAATLYGSGIDMAEGLLAGIRSKQSELESLAKELADAFNSAFQANITVAIENAVGQAAVDEIDLGGAKAALAAQQEALTAINTKIANAQRYIKNINDDIKEAGATKKLAEYVAEQTKILGRIDELTSMIGRVETFTPTPLPVAGLASQGSVTNNYNITVESNTRTQGAKAGEEIATSLQQLSNTSSNYSVTIG